MIKLQTILKPFVSSCGVLAVTLWLSGLPTSAQAQSDDLPRCMAEARKRGVPQDLASAMYLIEWANPTYFAYLPCQAAVAKVKFSYAPGGLLHKESFELKGKQSVQVWMVRKVAADMQTPLLVPVQFEINGSGNVANVNTGTLQVLAVNIRTILSNE